VTTLRERAAVLVADMRASGFVFHLDTDGPKVRPASPDCKLTPALLDYLKSLRAEVIEVLVDEQHQAAPEPAAAVAPPAPAPWAQVGPATEPCNTVALAPAPEPEHPRAVLICGASAWPASHAGAILERLGRLPKGTTVLIHGNTETRNRKGPVGAAAIAKAAMALGAGVPVVTVAAGELDAVLSRVGLVLVFHPHLNGRTATAAVVARAKALGVPVEVITGSVTPEAAR
jgi:hypothetical protein